MANNENQTDELLSPDRSHVKPFTMYGAKYIEGLKINGGLLTTGKTNLVN